MLGIAPGWGIKAPPRDAVVVFGSLYAGCCEYENGDWRGGGTLKLFETLDDAFLDSDSDTFGGVGLVEYGRKNPFGLCVGAANAEGADATLVADEDD